MEQKSKDKILKFSQKTMIQIVQVDINTLCTLTTSSFPNKNLVI